GLAGDDDLAAVGRGADTGGGVYRKSDVSRVGQARTAAMDPHSNAALHVVRPRSLAHPSLDGHPGLDGRDDVLEDGEELVGPNVDLPPPRLAHRAAKDRSDVFQELRVPVAQLAEQRGRALDVGEEEGEEARGKRGRVGRTSLELADLPGDEADRHDAVSLGGVQQTLAGPLLGSFVLEGDPPES